MQNLVRQFRITPPTGTIEDGRQRNFDMLMGTNFADGKGNITAFLSYRHADPVASSDRDFGGCQLNPTFDATTGHITGVACGGSSNSNSFRPASGPNKGNGLQCLRDRISSPWARSPQRRRQLSIPSPISTCRARTIVTTPRSWRTSRSTDYFQPYAEFLFHGRQDASTGRALGLVQRFESARPADGKLQCQLQQSFVERAGAIHTLYPGADCRRERGPRCRMHIYATPGGPVMSPNCVNVRIGRRNIEGGGRISDFEHMNYRRGFRNQGRFRGRVEL